METEYHISYRLAETAEKDGRLQLVDAEAEKFKAWRESHGLPDVPREILPELGIVARLDGEDAAAGWLYRCQGISVGFVEWFCSRPGLSLSAANQAMHGLMRGLNEIASEVGVTVLIGAANKAVSRMVCRQMGFLLFDKEHFLLMKEVK